MQNPTQSNRPGFIFFDRRLGVCVGPHQLDQIDVVLALEPVNQLRESNGNVAALFGDVRFDLLHFVGASSIENLDGFLREVPVALTEVSLDLGSNCLVRDRGVLDPVGPYRGFAVLLRNQKYRCAKEKFKSIRYPDLGHIYTPEMRKEMLAWFEKW